MVFLAFKTLLAPLNPTHAPTIDPPQSPGPALPKTTRLQAPPQDPSHAL
jgi:hypothetical protein